MNIDGAFPSKWIKAADLQGRAVKVTVKSVIMEKIADDEDPKPVMYFDGKEKGLVMNKTNAQIMSGSLGSETDAWTGKEIELRPDKTTFGGRLVDCLRVAVPMQVSAASDDPNDDIPW